jgi:hypothetical protein
MPDIIDKSRQMQEKNQFLAVFVDEKRGMKISSFTLKHLSVTIL